MKSKNAIMRKAGALEGIMWLTGEATPTSVCFVAKVHGEITPERLTHALRALQRRHPLLRSRTERIKRDLFFVERTQDQLLPIPLSLRPPASNWVNVAEEEITFRFNPEAGEWARCALIPQDNGAILLLTMHHMICDGISLSSAVMDILESCDQMNRGLPPDLPSMSLPDPLENRLPREFVKPGLFGLAQTLRALRRQKRERSRVGGKHSIIRVDATTSYENRTRRIEPILFDAETTSALRERARAEETTIHGALGAALLLSLMTEVNHACEPPVFALGSPFNLRQRLSPPVGDDCALFAIFGISFHQMSHERGFWDIARAIRRQTNESLGRGDPYIGVKFASLLAGNRLLLPLNRSGVSRYVSLFESYYRDTATTGLTNIGVIDPPAHLQTVTCEWGCFIPSQALLCFTSLTACTINGQLMLTFLYAEPTISNQRGLGIAEKIKAQLDNALRAQSASQRTL